MRKNDKYMLVKYDFKKSILLLLIIYLILFLFSFLSIDYSDGRETFLTGYKIVRFLFDGNIKSLASIEYTYGFFVYLLLAIWSIPVVALDIFARIDTPSSHWEFGIAHILCYKFFLLFFFLLLLLYVFKIYEEIVRVNTDNRGNDSIWVVTFFATSPCFFYFPFTITQCDIVTLTFLVMSIYYILVKDDEKAFSLLMACSVSIKYLSLFAYVPLIIYLFIYNIRKLIRVCIPSAIMLGVSGYIHNLTYYVVREVSTEVDLAYQSALGIMQNIRFILIYAFLIFIVFLYSRNKPEKIKSAELYIISYICTIAFIVLFFLYRFQFYWLILVEPFFLIMILYKNKWSYFVIQKLFVLSYISWWCINNNRYVLGNMPFSFCIFKDYKVLWGDSGIIRFVDVLLYKLGMSRETMVTLLYCISVLLVIYLLAVLFPRRNTEYRYGSLLETKTSKMWQLISISVNILGCSLGLACEFVGRYIMYYK